MPGSTLPSAELFFATANAHQQSAALRAAVDLNVFTAIGRDRLTSSEIAAKCECAEKGIRVLCDFSTSFLFLTKDGSHYSSTPDTGFFLDRNSPAYLGGTLKFLEFSDADLWVKDLTETVRKGGTTLEQGGTVAPEHPIWKEFAKAMAPDDALSCASHFRNCCLRRTDSQKSTGYCSRTWCFWNHHRAELSIRKDFSFRFGLPFSKSPKKMRKRLEFLIVIRSYPGALLM